MFASFEPVRKEWFNDDTTRFPDAIRPAPGGIGRGSAPEGIARDYSRCVGRRRMGARASDSGLRSVQNVIGALGDNSIHQAYAAS